MTDEMKLVLAHDPEGQAIGIRLDAPPYDTEGLTAVLLGNKGSGKSNTLAVLVEEAYRLHLPFVFFDPNGDAASLRELGDDVIVVGNCEHRELLRRADYSPAVARVESSDFVRMVLHEGFSLVFDMSDSADDDPLQTFLIFVMEHYRQAAMHREPVMVVIDEAHCFAPQSGANAQEAETRRALGRVAADGRKRGMLLVAASQHATYLHKRIIRAANIRLFGKITYWPDYNDVIKHYVTGLSFQQMQGLRSGQTVIVSERASGIVQVRRRTTTDLGQTPAFRRRSRKRRPSKVRQLSLEELEGG